MSADDLKSLSIYELRKLAREIGVKAPTTKGSDLLINEIIAIQRGELEPFRSKMGRPPKGVTLNYVNLENDLKESTLMKNKYVQLNTEGDYILSSTKHIFKDYECCGIVRFSESDAYIRDYWDNMKYGVIVPCDFKTAEGDVIIGWASDYSSKLKKITKYETFAFDSANVTPKRQANCIDLDDVDEMYDYIQKQEGNKFIVEAETLKDPKSLIQPNTLFVYSKECDDAIESYNMLLDVKNAVKVMCAREQAFTLYLVDIEYLYATLNMYYDVKKQPADLNAGQFFKEIFSLIRANKNANLTIFRKNGVAKNKYLDIIINKYCKNK